MSHPVRTSKVGHTLPPCNYSLACVHCRVQVNDFSADAVVSQLLLLDAQDPTKVCRSVGGVV